MTAENLTFSTPEEIVERVQRVIPEGSDRANVNAQLEYLAGLFVRAARNIDPTIETGWVGFDMLTSDRRENQAVMSVHLQRENSRIKNAA